MKMKGKITINEDDFFDIMTDTATKLSNNMTDAIKFGTFCTIVHNKIFSKTAENKTGTPFKSGDTVFVIDNECDYNNFVNRVVTVVKVDDYGACVVTDGNCEQSIYFKNLRKVETP